MVGHQESAAAALLIGLLRKGRFWAVCAVVPTICRIFATFTGKNPLAAQTDVTGEVPIDNAGSVAVTGRPSWNETDIVCVWRKHIART